MSNNATPPGDGAPPPKVSLFGVRASTPTPAASKPTPQPKRPKPRKRGSSLSTLSALLSFVVIGAVIGLVGFGAALVETRKTGPLDHDKVVVIEREDDAGSIATQLEQKGVIDNATIFWALTLLDGRHSLLKRGEYAFKAGVTMREIEEELSAHKVVQHKFTVPEGLTSDQIVQRMREEDALIGEVKESPREGSLYPDTYFFERGDTRQAILSRMAKANAKAVDEIWKRRATDLPIKSPGELVTLASIVEKETGKADERPRVAGVFVNRLQKHMKLQSDPTIVYGLVFGKGTLGHSITKSELEQPTPYNTYNIDGLPPGPICNPGKAALEAVANPVRSRELFFVADGTGGHAFAETIDQHLKNVAHWRQIEKDAKDRLSPDATPPAIRGDAGPMGDRFGTLPPLAKSLRADPRIFGALALFAPAQKPSALSAIATKLTKYGESAQRRDALLGAGGPLSPEKIGRKSMEDMGAVVTGVNDAPEMASFVGMDDSGPMPTGPLMSVPLSPAALADQRAREAKYGDGMPSDARMARVDPQPPVSPAAPSGRPRIYDASEGTKLDPLKNKTYDLSYAKTIPDFK